MLCMRYALTERKYNYGLQFYIILKREDGKASNVTFRKMRYFRWPTPGSIIHNENENIT